MFEALERRRLLAASLSEFPIRTVGGASQGVAADPDDGDIWVALPNTIDQINPSTGAIVQSYPIPTYNSGAGLITYDHADGTIWFYEAAVNRFGVLDPTAKSPDQAITELPVQTNPNPGVTAIAADPRGNIWFTESAFDEIGMLDTADKNTSQYESVSHFHLSPGAAPYGITVDPKGKIWFTESGLNQIGWVDPTSHVIQEVPITGSSGTDQSEGITAGPNNTIWFVETQANQVVTYNPQNTSSPFTTFAIPAGARLSAITWGQNADGNIWFTEPGLGKMGVLTPSSLIPAQLSNSYYSSATTVVAGPDGDYWINDTSNPYVAKATSNGVTPVAIPTNSAIRPQGIASLDGAIWFVDYDTDEIGMFDPTTHDSTEYPLPGSANPDQLIAVNNALWFTDHGSNQIGEFDPTTDTYTAYNLTTSGGGPTGITFDQQDGYFWFTEPSQNAIGFLDPTASGSPSKIYSAGNNTAPTGIVADSSGNLWFTDYGTGAIGEYTPSTAAFHSYGSNVSGPYHLIIGPDQDLWYTSYWNSVIGTFNLSSDKTTVYGVPGHSVEGVSSGTDDLVAGPDGNIWYTGIGAFTGDVDQYVGSVSTTGTNAQDQPTPGNFPNADITAGPDGNVWFSSFYTFGNGPGMIGAVTLSSSAVATQLAVTTQPPGDVTANEPASNGFGLVVSVENSSGQLDSFFQSNQGSVTIQLVPPAGVNGQFLSGTTTEPVNDGVAVFSGLTINDPGDGYTIRAILSGLSSATSDAFNVTSQATHLVVQTGPSGSVPAGSTIPLVIAVEDDNGNVDASYNGPVTVALATGTGTLGGTLIVGATAGIADFQDLSIAQPGSNDRIQATSESLTPTETAAFNVTIGAAYQWVIQTPPSPNAVAGQAFLSQPVLVEEDQFRNVETGDSSTVVTATVSGGSVTLTGRTATVKNGVATFTALTDDTAGYAVFTFSGGGLKVAASQGTVVSPAPVDHFGVTTSFTDPDAAGTAGTVTVTAYDAFNNVVSSGTNLYKGTVDLSSSDEKVSELPATYTFTAADRGSHEFDGVVLVTVGSQTITAADSVNSKVRGSATIDVIPGPATQVAITSTPLVLAAGDRGQVTVQLEDSSGNEATSTSDQTISLSTTSTTGAFYAGASGGNTITSVVIKAGNSSATFYYGDTQAGAPMVTASDATLDSSSNQTETVNPGPADQVAITSTALILAAGDRGQVTVQLEDSSGNDTVASSNETIDLTTTSNGGAFYASASGGNTITNVVISTGSGSATFYYSDTKAGSPTVTASDSDLGSAPTQTETVNPGPAKTVVITSTPLSLIAGTRGQVTVQLEDAYNNPNATSTSNQTISLSTTSAAGAFYAGPSGGNPIASVVISAGQPSASVYYFDTKSGTPTITASDSMLNSTVTQHETVDPAAADHFVVTTSFVNPDVAGTAGSVTVTAEDHYGNTVGSGPNIYRGTVNLTSTDGQMTGLPSTYTFNAADAGSHTFTNVALVTAGTQTITATDSVNSSITGTSPTIMVSAGPAVSLAIVKRPPGGIPAGSRFTIVINALDQYGNVATSFNGDVTVALASGSAGSLGGTLKQTAVAGVATFDDLVDTVSGSITITASSGTLTTGSSGGATLPIDPATVSQLAVSVSFASPDIAGTAGNVTVTAEDPYGNPVGNGSSQYVGTVNLVSSDGQASNLPASYTFTLADASSHTFNNIILKTAGSQTITATDSVNSSITGSSTVDVVPAAASQVAITGAPLSLTAGSRGSIVVQLEDDFHNTGAASTADQTISLSTTGSAGAFYAGPSGGGAIASVVIPTDQPSATVYYSDTKSGTPTVTASDSALSSAPAQQETVDPAAADHFVVTTSFANPDVAGTAGNVTVTAEDPYGNTVGSGPNAYRGTVKLSSSDSRLAGLPASDTFTAGDGGSRTFTNVVLETAGSQTIAAADSVTSSIAGDATVNVVAAAVSQLVFLTPPPDPITAGQSFTVVVAATDAYGNPDTSYSGSVTITLPGQPGSTITVQAVNGVATFPRLTLGANTQGGSIQVAGDGLTAASTSPVQVNSATNALAPTIAGELVVMSQKKNKKGKPVGKPVLQGFTLDFSTAMNAATAGSAANYRITATSTKHAKKKTIPPPTPVPFTAAYNAATNSVTLTLAGKQAFAKGGQITVNYSAISSASGVGIDSSDATFTIAPKGTGVTPG